MTAVLVSCGGTDFSGTWRGPVSLAYACANGSRIDSMGGVEWTIAQTGNTLTITPDGGCPSIVADVVGSTAELRATNCGGGAAVEGGKATLESPTSLRISLQDAFPSTGGACSGQTTGTLTRAP